MPFYEKEEMGPRPEPAEIAAKNFEFWRYVKRPISVKSDPS